MRRIKSIFKRREEGAIFILVLIVLLVGSLIIPPTLSLMNTGIRSGQVFETRTAELYAADSGIDDALLWMKNNSGSLPEEIPMPLPDSGFTIDGKQVYVTIAKYPAKPNTYKIISEAKVGGVTKTIIESYVERTNLPSNFLNNAITSPGNVTIKSGAIVGGDVQLNGVLDNKGIINGVTTTAPLPNWPTSTSTNNIPPLPEDQLAYFYWQDVKNLTPYAPSTLSVATNVTLPSIYHNGNFTISGDANGITLTIGGTIFINGNLTIAQSGNKNPTVDLNGQTIYVNGTIDVSSKINFIGTGAIIAKGDINYQPNTEGADFTFLMSLRGTTHLAPGGDFIGSIAGAAAVELWPGCNLTHTAVPPGLNVPDFTTTGDTGAATLKILTHNITTQ